MPNAIVLQIQGWVQTYKACADNALTCATNAVLDGTPTADAAQMNFRQATQNHATVMVQCSALLTAAIQIVASDAQQTLDGINTGTKQLGAVVSKVQDVERAMTVLGDLVTTVTDVALAVSTLNLGSAETAAKDLQTLVKDTIGA